MRQKPTPGRQSQEGVGGVTPAGLFSALVEVGHPLSPLLLAVENRWTDHCDGVLSFQANNPMGGVQMLDTVLDMVMVFDAVCFTVLIADEIRWSLSRLRR